MPLRIACVTDKGAVARPQPKELGQHNRRSWDSDDINDAGLVCGGVRTANATVYMIDTVLMPPAA